MEPTGHPNRPTGACPSTSGEEIAYVELLREELDRVLGVDQIAVGRPRRTKRPLLDGEARLLRPLHLLRPLLEWEANVDQNTAAILVI